MDVHTNEEDGVHSYLVDRIRQLEEELKSYVPIVQEENETMGTEVLNNEETVEETTDVAPPQEPTTPTRAVPYGPVPMSWNISHGQSDNGPVIVLSVQTPEGDKVFFLTPSVGTQLGEALVKLSSAAESDTVTAD